MYQARFRELSDFASTCPEDDKKLILRAYRKVGALSVTDFVRKSGISNNTFYMMSKKGFTSRKMRAKIYRLLGEDPPPYNLLEKRFFVRRHPIRFGENVDQESKELLLKAWEKVGARSMLEFSAKMGFCVRSLRRWKKDGINCAKALEVFRSYTK